jgi:hypothetical protein
MKALALALLLALTPSAALAAKPKDTGFRKASYKVALKGTQVTSWKYHKDKGPDPCDFYANGEGSQEVRFRTSAAAPLLAVDYPSHRPGGDRPTLWRKFTMSPLVAKPPLYEVNTTVDRQARTSSGGHAPSCPNRYSGGGAEPPASDCGKHGFKLSLSLGYRYRNRLNLEEDATKPGLADRLPYQHCELHGERGLLLEGLGIELPASKLFGLKRKKAYEFVGTDVKDVPVHPGGMARTGIRYTITLTRTSKVRRSP